VTSVGLAWGFSVEAKGDSSGSTSAEDTGDGLLWRKAIGIDLAHMEILFDSRAVTESPNPVINGTYKTTIYSGFVTFRVNF